MRRRPEEPELLGAIAELVDDGFASLGELATRLRQFGRRDLTKGYQRLAKRGMVLERRGPDGGIYLALTGEGWQALRDGVGVSPPPRSGRSRS
jgi:hypothetical protein